MTATHFFEFDGNEYKTTARFDTALQTYVCNFYKKVDYTWINYGEQRMAIQGKTAIGHAIAYREHCGY